GAGRGVVRHLGRLRRGRQDARALDRGHVVPQLERGPVRRTGGPAPADAQRPDAPPQRTAGHDQEVEDRAAGQPARRARDPQPGPPEFHGVRREGDGGREGTVIAMRAPTCVALLVALLLPAMAAAQESTDLTGTVVFTMKGSFAKDEAAANDVGWGGISIGFTGDNAGKVRWFGVVHASLFGGNTFGAKSAIFRAHEVPALTVAGPPELAKQL